MGIKNDLAGMRIGNLTVQECVGKGKDGHSLWSCDCDCGRNVKILYNNLTRKNNPTQTCGNFECEYHHKLIAESKKQYNSYNLEQEYGIGYTLKGEEFYFDLEDYDLIKDYCWYIDNDGYLRTNVYKGHNKRTSILMHSLIMNTIDNLFYVPDHIHGRESRNDNRKCNLRIADNTQNAINQQLRKDNTSGYKGINWDKRSNKWVVRIQTRYKRIYIGRYNTLEKAVEARKNAELTYHGEWAYDVSQAI